jgi:hypothetical protein
MTCFQFDFSLLSALLDHWRPETHTFYFTVGEITVTLQDTSLLWAFLVRASRWGLRTSLLSGVQSSSRPVP